MQTAFDRLLLRAARRIHANLARPDPQPTLRLPRPEWRGCCNLSRKIIRTESTGLTLAAGRLRIQLYGMFQQLRGRVCDQLDEFRAGEVRFPSVQDLFDDLRGLRNEFADVEIDFPNRVLAVATEPITIEQVELGAFWIQLPWDDCAEYRVQAVDLVPDLCDDDHPHPHVSGDQLCEGDGHSSIHRALKEGPTVRFLRARPPGAPELQPRERLRQARTMGVRTVRRLRGVGGHRAIGLLRGLRLSLLPELPSMLLWLRRRSLPILPAWLRRLRQADHRLCVLHRPVR